MVFTIVPISYETLTAAQDLAVSIFKYERARRTLAAALDPKIADDYEDMKGFSDRAAWVALDENMRVVGITGLYCDDEDKHEADWLNWYCVAPHVRGQGLGKILLDKSINEARARGKKVLRLWTTDGRVEADAQIVYEKNGFEVFKTEPFEGEYEGCKNILYRQKVL